MKDTVMALSMLCIGCLSGVAGAVPDVLLHGGLTTFILYALVFQVGVGMGAGDNFTSMLRGMSARMLLLPVATMAGTLLFSLMASSLIANRSPADCLAVGSGFAYYSLSSVLITEVKGATAGVKAATELGTLALLANVIREVVSLVGAPVFTRMFGKFAPISAAGINSMDVMLPSISRCSGKDMVPFAIFHGITLELSVPLLVTMFCKM